MPPRPPFCSTRDWLAVRPPSSSSHKGDNGRLLILAGSKQYHGSLLLAVRAAIRFCDLVYVHSISENAALIRRLKSSSPNLIYLDSHSLSSFFSRMDAFCVGPGWENNSTNRRLLARVLATKKPAVIDAAAFSLLNKKQLHANVILTPHHGEFEKLFGQAATPSSVQAASKRFHCVILLKGPTDFIASSSSLAANRTHHAGMTKGGSGDVLAGLTAALLASHTLPFQAAKAAAYLNGLSGIRLSKRMGSHYSSEDLANELPFSASILGKSRRL